MTAGGPVTVETYDQLEAAARALGGGGAAYFGGGTVLMRALNYGEERFERLVRATDPTLRRVRALGDRVEIGAGVTMAQILDERELAFLQPAARSVGGPAVRSMATVGGNLFAEHPYGDLATALLALDGQAHFAGGGQPTPLEVLFQERGRGRGGERLVAAVSVVRPASGTFRFRKVSRVKPKGISVMCLAAWLPGVGGRLGAPRIAFGAMGPTPLRAHAAERALEGRMLDEGGIAPAVAAATEGLAPPTDALASEWYRRETAPAQLRRLLLEAA